MAKLEDVLPYLSPDLIEKTYNMIQSPATTGTGILSAIKDFDAVEAANFIKEKAADYAFDTYLGGDLETMTGGGINPDQSGLTSGIFSKAGDVALNELGLPVSTADVKDIASVFTDPETGGGDIANMGLELVKNMGKERALNYVASTLGMSNPLFSFIMATPVGQDITQQAGTMSGDIFGMTGIPWLFNRGKNMLGFNAAASDPVITPDPVFTPPNIEGNIALNQTPAQVAAQVAASQATQQGDYQAPTMTQQEMVQEAQQTGGTVNPHEVTQAVYSAPRPRPPTPPRPHHSFAQGGLVSMARVLKK